MIAQQRAGARGAGEIKHFAAIGPAIDQIAEKNHAVLGQGSDQRKQFREFEMASVNVADGDESPVHAAEKC
jgi:hypothetical protein